MRLQQINKILIYFILIIILKIKIKIKFYIFKKIKNIFILFFIILLNSFLLLNIIKNKMLTIVKNIN